MFERDVNSIVEDALNKFIDEFKVRGLDFNTSETFSKFITLSANCTYDHRYSVSKLSQIFNNEGFPTSELLKIYMIALLCLQEKRGTEFIW